MIRVLPFLVVVMVAAGRAQAPQQNLVKQGAQIFMTNCTGYCHAPAGAGGGAAPRLAARGFDEAYINTTITSGVPGTPMSGFSGTLSRVEIAAVTAYVASLNGMTGGGSPAAVSGDRPVLSADEERGRQLFSDAVRSFGRCSTCHEVDGIGISVATPIVDVPSGVPLLRRLMTPHVVTASAAGETMPALVVNNGSRSTIFYDLSTPPPVLRTAPPGSVKFANASPWQHSSVIDAYTDSDLALILDYLRAVSR
jgi:mono/diheme cytochrome c family protein